VGAAAVAEIASVRGSESLPRLLLADDSAPTRTQLGRLLEIDPGVSVDGVPDGGAALQALAARRYGAVLTDLRMPHVSGLELLEALHRQRLTVPVIVFTGYGDVADATRAMRLGAFDFLTKPVDVERLRRVVGRALAEQSAVVPGAGRDARAFHGLLSKNPAMHAVLDLIARVAHSPSTVLLEGETGTGKEQVARAIHRATPGRSGPLVAVSCAAVPETLLESEFFGHETLTPEALDALQTYGWPGNIRELENAIERACVLAPGTTIRPEDLPAEVLRPVPIRRQVEVDLTRPLLEQVNEARAMLEEGYIRTALRKSRGNISRCADLCGLSRRSVARKLADYRIDKGRFREKPA
jgi:DNA-binding NtrC family response regulator